MPEPLDSPKWSGTWGLPPSTPPPPPKVGATGTSEPKRSGNRSRWIWLGVGLVIVILAGIVIAVVAVNDTARPLPPADWAASYCDVISSYESEAATRIRQTTAALAEPGNGVTAKSEIVRFGEFLDDVLGRVESLTTDHPISGEGGAELTTDLRTALGRTRGILGDALTQIRGLDASAADFQVQALAVLTSSGISFDTRIATAPSPALNRLNVAIAQNGNCESFFTAS